MDWRSSVVYGLCYALLIFSPFVCLAIAGKSLATEIEPSIIGGFITASGIFAGFLTSVAVSKKEYLAYHHYLLLIADLVLFVYALNEIFLNHLIFMGKPNFFDFASVLMSVNANAFLAITFASRLLFHKLAMLNE